MPGMLQKVVIVCALALARRYTVPLMFTVCVPMDVVPRPLVPVPSDVKVIVPVPLLLPAVAVLMPMMRLLLLLDPAASRLNDPLVVALPVAPPRLALSFSLKPSLVAELLNVSACVAVSPT